MDFFRKHGMLDPQKTGDGATDDEEDLDSDDEVSEILPRQLFLGDFHCARRRKDFERLGYAAVVNCTPESQLPFYYATAEAAGQWHALSVVYGRHRRPVARSN